jgi:signal transduction histidine kinase/ActR/RegA family two-component response regulator
MDDVRMDALALENRELRRRMRDLVAFLGLPALWAGRDVRGVAEVAADVLLSVMHVDQVYVRCVVDDEPPVEVVRVPAGPLDPDAAREARQALGGPPDVPESLSVRRVDPSAADSLIVATVRLGSTDGVLAAAARRAGFPEEFERLLLNSAASQVAIALRERQHAAEKAHVLDTVNRVGRVLAAELDMPRLVQGLTDAARELTGAEFAAYFYNVSDGKGERYMLYALSGAAREAFAGFPMPRNTGIFAPTFEGRGIVRYDDVRRAPEFGRNPPYHGMPQGHLPVASYLAVPVISRSGEVLGGLFFGHREVGVFTDREEQIIAGLAAQAAIALDNARLFEQAQRHYQEAQDANRLKDEFLATLSHELRTPLNSMVGWVHLLRSGRLDAGAQEHALVVIARSLDTQTQLISDMLDLSRIATGRLRLEVAAVNLAEVVSQAVDTVRLAAEAKGVRLHTILDPIAGEVSGDAGRLQQVAWNLLSNAVKFTPKDGSVQVRLQGERSRVELTVSDTGAGIHADFLPHVFDQFRQADSSSTRRHGGLGLGLTIVKRLVELHGGTVRVASDGPGRGSTFVVSLPRRPLADVTTSGMVALSVPADGPPAALAALPSLRGVRVLVVEDQADGRELVAAVLELAGATVTAVGSAEAALRSLESRPPHVLISDIEMPEMDGYQLIQRVRALPGDRGAVPAVALTAYAAAPDRLRALSAGFQLHLAKPAVPAELVTAVARLAEAQLRHPATPRASR